MQETCVRPLGWEDPLEVEMATHSSTFAWKTPWTEEPGRLQSIGSQRVRQTEQLSTAQHIPLGFPGGSAVKSLPAVQEAWVQSLGWRDPLEVEMATHSSTLAWEILRTENPGELQSIESQKSRTRLSDQTTVSAIPSWEPGIRK